MYMYIGGVSLKTSLVSGTSRPTLKNRSFFHESFNIFDFTTAGDWGCVAAVERLPALHYRVDFIFLSFGIMGFIVELWNY